MAGAMGAEPCLLWKQRAPHGAAISRGGKQKDSLTLRQHAMPLISRQACLRSPLLTEGQPLHASHL